MNEESGLSRYDEVILAVFTRLIGMDGSAATRLAFDKELLDVIGNEINIKNIPDILYSYRSGRRTFPREIRESGDWVIVGEGKGHYAFVKLDVPAELVLPLDLEVTPILDATPEVVARYTKGDEQSLLVKIRYNRLIDVFTGLTAYHLQSHMRTTVKELGQIEVDDLYLGVDQDGRWYCIPVEAKPAGNRDQLGRIQLSSMVAFSEQEFPTLPVRPVGVKRMEDGSIFFVEFTPISDPLQIQSRVYKRYMLVRDR